MRSQQGFLIQLENPIRSFFPGQTIIGSVIVTNEKPKDLKNISIIFEGQARVHWTERQTVTRGSGKNRTRETRTVHYSSEEKYFTCKIILFGNDSTTTLPKGVTSYPFQFTLPGNLPSSFASSIGTVHYLMEARMKRTWHKSDLTSVVPFTVNGILDLNKEIGVDHGAEVKKQKNICCLCFKSGPVGYFLKIPRKGFVPGEFLPFTMEMINMSRRKVNSARVFLVQTATFHAQGKTKRIVKVICDAYGPGVEPGESDSWGGQVLQIPAIPPTRLANCSIVDVQYSLNFEMDIKGPAINLRAEIPIVIGTIPLRNTFIDLMPSSRIVGPAEPRIPLASPASAPPYIQQGYGMEGPGPSIPSSNMNYPIPSAPIFDMYPDLPPPTYAESMNLSNFGEVNNEASDAEYLKGKDNAAFSPGKKDKQSHIVTTGGTDATNDEGTSGPSAPPQAPTPQEINFVPNYITYGFYNNNINMES